MKLKAAIFTMSIFRIVMCPWWTVSSVSIKWTSSSFWTHFSLQTILFDNTRMTTAFLLSLLVPMIYENLGLSFHPKCLMILRYVTYRQQKQSLLFVGDFSLLISYSLRSIFHYESYYVSLFTVTNCLDLFVNLDSVFECLCQ